MNKGIDAQEILQIRQDFPLFRNDPVIYLDNSATTQKPDAVLNAVSEFYGHDNANPFRGIYDLSERATERYEAARETVSKFIHAESPSEIVFTRNASESLNLAANCLAELLLQPGDEVIVTIVEHHSNFLPWLQAAKRHGAALKFLECDAKGEIPLEALEEAITDKTRLVTMTQMSNVFGREYDVKAAAALCHSKGDIVVIADGSQSVPHIKVDVQDLGVDFLAFSGHKMLAPMGIGVLWGKKKWLDAMPPFLFGGEMIQSVSREGAVYAEVPHKFEAGTVNAGGAVGLEAAIHYIEQIGFDRIRQREEHERQHAQHIKQKQTAEHGAHPVEAARTHLPVEKRHGHQRRDERKRISRQPDTAQKICHDPCLPSGRSRPGFWHQYSAGRHHTAIVLAYSWLTSS